MAHLKPFSPESHVTSSLSPLVAATARALMGIGAGARHPGTASPFINSHQTDPSRHLSAKFCSLVDYSSSSDDAEGEIDYEMDPTSISATPERETVHDSQTDQPQFTQDVVPQASAESSKRPSTMATRLVSLKRPRTNAKCDEKAWSPRSRQSRSDSGSDSGSDTASDRDSDTSSVIVESCTESPPTNESTGSKDVSNASVPGSPEYLPTEAVVGSASIASPQQPRAKRGLPRCRWVDESDRSDDWVLQAGSCITIRRQEAQQCHDCITRYSRCSFAGIRSFPRIEAGSDQLDFDRGTLRPSRLDDEVPHFPTEFDRSFVGEDAIRIKTVASHHLLPTLKEELEHAQKSDCVRIRHELFARQTCDTCLHVIFCGAYKCMCCGRDLCMSCYDQLLKLKDQPIKRLSNADLRHSRYLLSVVEGDKDGTGHASAFSEPHPMQQDRLHRCAPRTKSHSSKDFTPYTRRDAQELEHLVIAMQEWKESNPLEVHRPPAKDILDALRRSSGDQKLTNSWPHMYLRSEELVDPFVPHQAAAVNEKSSDPPPPTPSWFSAAPIPVKTEDPKRFSFADLWVLREPIVVDIGKDTFHLDWSPQHFIDTYGEASCNVEGDATTSTTTVAKFFEKFGQRNPLGVSRKIKDWPPTTDFKSAFPREYADFMSLLPMGSMTRRDGVLNLAAHAPSNSNPPDLGPKGYFSEESDDRPGGQGSTKLHMDVADAVNVMLWAGPWKDGAVGAAAWDMFRVEDADKIRDFLYEHFAEKYGRPVAQMRLMMNELSFPFLSPSQSLKTDVIFQLYRNSPIHSQLVFLDQDLRTQLFKSKGVKPFRIWQRPGEAVFIPAGCAHQVCNYADCIKVASDFVSLENVASCWHGKSMTDEFRELTKECQLWRSDVLQLKTQLLWAWVRRRTGMIVPLRFLERSIDLHSDCLVLQKSSERILPSSGGSGGERGSD
ncbi:BZ3500_MvSof-1268-A1-R1_Chr1-3g02118 [Microbotryum saponariae]|uniref:BZ3500_MvSof-1268-A1-R1_Chr1-3g02118 protein n=1 Tax=Microbotryum saponariae TaxID=289078 RepID=A0A2X0KCM5_9BASI|nr:BZ3500_MvSof-1268-A1-R1_Chr1-3g02118 [Microbotryum saponariae]